MSPTQPLSPLVMNWPLSSLTGYGIYGLQILKQYLKEGGADFVLTDHLIKPLSLPADLETALGFRLDRASNAARFLDEHPREILRFDGPVLHGVGNCYATFKNQYRVIGRPNIGCAAIEERVCPSNWAPFMKIYDRFIAISRWNAEWLESLDFAPVHLHHQGVDPDLFYPHPGDGRFGDRFVIFSGGKFEFRKAQDIVTAAFKIFRERHPEALLVTAWQNMQVPDIQSFAASGRCSTVPEQATEGAGLQILPWLESQGLPPESMVDLGWVPNHQMPEILRNCHAAIFPNRCEGGTNVVAMEALACGVPTFVSQNTGQKDLIDLIGAHPFRNQRPVRPTPPMMSTTDWGETDPEEIVASLEDAYANQKDLRRQSAETATKMQTWSWATQNAALLKTILAPP